MHSALSALPAYFTTETVISGLRATDIFTLGATLGATIEDQVVATLNGMRAVWDPDSKYPLLRFIRQPQTFPDVLLAARSAEQSEITDIAFGVELKGWYLLAKEGEPSFRFKVTPAACADLDLIVVVPWYLSNVIAGHPRVFPPYIESARYAAAYRNYHWEHPRVAKGERGIVLSGSTKAYPKKPDAVSDKARADGGGNFGRFARSGLMEEYKSMIDHEQIAGIEARYWREFFKLFQEHDDASKIAKAFKLLGNSLAKEGAKGTSTGDFAHQVLDAIRAEFDLSD